MDIRCCEHQVSSVTCALTEVDRDIAAGTGAPVRLFLLETLAPLVIITITATFLIFSHVHALLVAFQRTSDFSSQSPLWPNYHYRGVSQTHKRLPVLETSIGSPPLSSEQQFTLVSSSSSRALGAARTTRRLTPTRGIRAVRDTLNLHTAPDNTITSLAALVGNGRPRGNLAASLHLRQSS